MLTSDWSDMIKNIKKHNEDILDSDEDPFVTVTFTIELMVDTIEEMAKEIDDLKREAIRHYGAFES